MTSGEDILLLPLILDVSNAQYIFAVFQWVAIAGRQMSPRSGR